MSGWFVYLLLCRDGSLYCGATNDPWRRFLVHADGKGARYTRARLPLKLVFLEETESRSAALRLEHAIKRLPASTKRRVVHDQVASTTHVSRQLAAARRR